MLAAGFRESRGIETRNERKTRRKECWAARLNVASWHRARNCRQSAAGVKQRRQSNERIFQLPAPAEMQRLCLSINMRRDKAAAWSFIRSFVALSGSLGLRVVF